MQRYFTIQPSMRPDFRLPYPFFVRENGLVDRQDFWRGKVYRVIGFQASLDKMTVDLFWSEAAKDPEKATGMYVVLADDKNDWSTETSPVQPLAFEELEESYVIVQGDLAGRSDTLEGAKREFKRLGGALGDGYEIQLHLGYLAPEIKVVKPRRRS